MFFTAFETEIEAQLLHVKNKETRSAITAEFEVPKTNSIVKEVGNNIVTTKNDSATAIVKIKSTTIPLKEIRNLTTPGMSGSYYLVTNVFSNVNLAEKWSKKLIAEGYNP